MAVVKVKSHYQVTLSPQIRAKAGVVVGDLFEAKVEGRTITLVQKRLIDHELRWRSTTSSVVGPKGRFIPLRRQFVLSAAGRHDRPSRSVFVSNIEIFLPSITPSLTSS